jgi:hypothetical protein
MLIDLHVHTTRYSPCGRSTPEAMCARAIEVGLDGLVLTEHNIVWEAEEMTALQAQFPTLKLFRGVEINSACNEDYLIYGITEPGVFTAHMDDIALIERVRAGGGTVVLAHPYRHHPTVPDLLGQYPVDGVEIYSHNILNCAHPRARALCARLGCFPSAASDGHAVDALGMYAMLFPRTIHDERDLAQALRAHQAAVYVDSTRVAARNASLRSNLVTACTLQAQGLVDLAIRERLPGLSLTILRGLREGQDVLWPGDGQA